MPPTLENITGTYLAAIQTAVPETIQTSAEIQKARVEANARGDTSLNIGFYTANVPLYGVENGKPFLLFGGREAFLRLYYPNIQEVYNQITTTKNHVYTLPKEDQEWVMDEGIRSGALTCFDLEELIEIKNENAEFCHFNLAPAKAHKLKGNQRELAKLIHGSDNDYLASMQMLARHKISESKIYLLTHDYVKSNAGNNLIGRASWLNSFSSNSGFDASGRSVNVNDRVRGVRREVAAGDTPTLPTNPRDQELITAITKELPTPKPTPSRTTPSPPQRIITPPTLEPLSLDARIQALNQISPLPALVIEEIKQHPYRIEAYEKALQHPLLEI